MSGLSYDQSGRPANDRAKVRAARRFVFGGDGECQRPVGRAMKEAAAGGRETMAAVLRGQKGKDQ